MARLSSVIRGFKLEVQLGDLKQIWAVSRFRKSLTTERVGLAKPGNGTNALVSWSYTVALQVESTIWKTLSPASAVLFLAGLAVDQSRE